MIKSKELDKVSGELTVKGQRCSKYMVTDVKCKELSAIAKKCGCKLSKIFFLNNLKSGNRVPIGTELFFLD